MKLHKIGVLVIRKAVVLTVIVSLAAAIAAHEMSQLSLAERSSDQEDRREEDAAIGQLKHFFFLDPHLVVAWN